MGSKGRLLVSEYYRYRGNEAELDKMATIVKDDVTFAPQYAIMVSWHDVSPYPATQYEGSQVGIERKDLVFTCSQSGIDPSQRALVGFQIKRIQMSI